MAFIVSSDNGEQPNNQVANRDTRDVHKSCLKIHIHKIQKHTASTASTTISHIGTYAPVVDRGERLRHIKRGARGL